MKAIVLSAGKGTRIKENYYPHKSLIRIGDKCLIDFSLKAVTNHQLVDEIVIVVGYHAQSIIDYVGNEYNGIKVSYVYQDEPLGIAHAVKEAKDVLNDDFILCLADEILIDSNLQNMVKHFYDSGVDCICGVVYLKDDKIKKPIAYEINENGEIIEVIEKPDSYNNDLRGLGECIFKKDTLKYLDILKPNKKRNEYEMGDWIQMIIDDNKKVIPFKVADGYLNINTDEDFDNLIKINEK